jgi:hypothetical protein
MPILGDTGIGGFLGPVGGQAPRAVIVSVLDNGYIVEYQGEVNAFITIDDMAKHLVGVTEKARKNIADRKEEGGAYPRYKPATPEEQAVQFAAQVEGACKGFAKAFRVPLAKVREKFFGLEQWQQDDDDSSENGVDEVK